jgi:uncharacterized membrane protein YhaH (DUF805 family)
MADPRLTTFVEAALLARQSKDDVRKALEQAGWSSEQIVDGLAHYSDVAFVVPVPRPRPHVSARDAFWYVLMFGTLYVSTFYVCDLLFSLINKAFPDQLSRLPVAFLLDQIRWAVAALIVAFPIFLLTARRIARDVAADATRRNSAIRKWLTNVTLLLAAAALVGDGMTLVYDVLGGELTVRFVLKVLVVAAVAGAGFGYYSWSLKADDRALKQ